ncbi:MAG: DUF4304 domain-containing protein [Burkholderiaceae bacterium]|nr:MAG: DUF4304 domain-containing protein [Burkholderiaceae bacterium]
MTVLDESQTDIRAILKESLVPGLRTRGFKGSFPHFRRISDSGVHLLTVQLDKWGTGNFVVEIAKAPLGPVAMPWGETVPANKLTAHHFVVRHRLGAAEAGDHWFQAQEFLLDPVTSIGKLLELVDSQGALWWDGA